ncbi:MAG TPA: ATP synthase F1 subunit gamma [Fimbriimonadaceae bacterium]|nr:ATP synthase F1 subunit gamma [Fimbriimonadaceae bacterium]
MANLKLIRQRIRAAKNIQQITKAMKLVAAARLKKATDRVLEARPYADKLREFMISLSGAGELPAHPLMEKRPVRNYALILITAERGLAGSYNTNLIRRAGEFLKETAGKGHIIGVGKKGHGFYGRRGVPVLHTVTVPAAGARYSDALEIATKARDLYVSGEVDAVYICYSKFYSAIRQTPQIVQLLPIEAPEGESGGSLDFDFEPDAESLMNTLLPRYFQTLVWQALLESTASEHGARMSAMTSATDNAGKMIQDLTLKANRERQASITTEILEVVGGAEALKA